MIRDFKQSVASFYLALHQSAAGMTPKKPGNKLACLTADSLVSKSVSFNLNSVKCIRKRSLVNTSLRDFLVLFFNIKHCK